MGKLIEILSRIVTKSPLGESPLKLRLAGVLITIIVVTLSGFSGWILERGHQSEELFFNYFSSIVLTIGLASSIASRSLYDGIQGVLNALTKTTEDNNLEQARIELSRIVGRDVNDLNEDEILRACAETASENSVDGIFAPLFWMTFGTALWQINPLLPGPLALAWMFKATSTIDSMIGYRYGKFRWLGTAGARLDDAMTFIPARLVMITLPLISQPWSRFPYLVKAAFKDGAKDISPNSGISEAIFAHCTGIKMGGENKYKNNIVKKPLIAENNPQANHKSIIKLLYLSLRLEIMWIILIAFIGNIYIHQ